MRILSTVLSALFLCFYHFSPAISSPIDGDQTSPSGWVKWSKINDNKKDLLASPCFKDEGDHHPVSATVMDEDEDDNDPDYVPQGPIHVTPIHLNGFVSKDPKKKRPFTHSKALKENLPPLPRELETSEGMAVWRAICKGAYCSYSGLTRAQRAFLKEIGFQEMIPSPSKKSPVGVDRMINNPVNPFHIDPQRQGYTRQNYRWIIDETRQHASFEQIMSPILEHHRAAMANGLSIDPAETNRLFWTHAASFFDIQERVDDHIFCLNSRNIQETNPQNGENVANRLGRGQNPLLKEDGAHQMHSGNYHHLTQGHSSPEILIYVSRDFHNKYHDLLHPFLKPGADSLVHTPEGGLKFARAKQELHKRLARQWTERTQQSAPQITGVKRNLAALFDSVDHQDLGHSVKKPYGHRFT